VLKLIILVSVFITSISFNIVAMKPAGLVLLTDRSRASGELRVYLKNTGMESVSVVTANLSMMASDSLIEIEPERHVLVKDSKMVPLKESLADYSVVLLKPGEVTYLKRISIMKEHGKLQYYVKNSWAQMHNIWGGKITIDF